jgi:hypothetical protein
MYLLLHHQIQIIRFLIFQSVHLKIVEFLFVLHLLRTNSCLLLFKIFMKLDIAKDFVYIQIHLIML